MFAISWVLLNMKLRSSCECQFVRATLLEITSGYATWFTAGGAIRAAHYDVVEIL